MTADHLHRCGDSRRVDGRPPGPRPARRRERLARAPGPLRRAAPPVRPRPAAPRARGLTDTDDMMQDATLERPAPPAARSSCGSRAPCSPTCGGRSTTGWSTSAGAPRAARAGAAARRARDSGLAARPHARPRPCGVSGPALSTSRSATAGPWSCGSKPAPATSAIADRARLPDAERRPGHRRPGPAAPGQADGRRPSDAPEPPAGRRRVLFQDARDRRRVPHRRHLSHSRTEGLVTVAQRAVAAVPSVA